ncbi:PREDICTED: protein RALF-like 4 [Tarenaya hassleriana]|uniref:protein RALF-like 4 n=1 Tax=Tarenaya hassleriana TaxID=28532 RepID=UPI00053C9902|nr:PREDICTED: protein RALF-like 4 [Tarenaya hassleriana]
MTNHITLLFMAVIIPAALTPASDVAEKVRCSALSGDCVKEEATEMSRRILKGTRYISYDALKRNNIPCNRRGRSYYNCGPGGPVNPYHRGCSVITHCYRFTN